MPPPLKASMQSIDFKEQERARPSGTHSSEVPLRTRSEYAPKDAPRMDTSFACSSSEQNISGVSDEPLLRINAKSQAVTGEPSRAGSAPIASAATTPQPAGRSIANSAAIWRRGIIVRLFERSDPPSTRLRRTSYSIGVVRSVEESEKPERDLVAKAERNHQHHGAEAR